MRGFLLLMVLAAVGLGALVFFVAPSFVRPMVVTAVRDALPFGDQPLQIDVSVTGLGLLDGHVDSIHVRGTRLVAGGAYAGATIETLDVTVFHVAIGNHAFDAVSGGLDGVGIPMADRHPLAVSRVDLSGDSIAVSGAARFSADEAAAFITRSLAEHGLNVSGVELTDGGVSLVVLGKRVDVALDVEGGALIVPASLGVGSITLLAPGTDDRWRMTGVSVTPDGMELDAVIDADALLSLT